MTKAPFEGLLSYKYVLYRLFKKLYNKKITIQGIIYFYTPQEYPLSPCQHQD